MRAMREGEKEIRHLIRSFLKKNGFRIPYTDTTKFGFSIKVLDSVPNGYDNGEGFWSDYQTQGGAIRLQEVLDNAPNEFKEETKHLRFKVKVLVCKNMFGNNIIVIRLAVQYWSDLVMDTFGPEWAED